MKKVLFHQIEVLLAKIKMNSKGLPDIQETQETRDSCVSVLVAQETQARFSLCFKILNFVSLIPP